MTAELTEHKEPTLLWKTECALQRSRLNCDPHADCTDLVSCAKELAEIWEKKSGMDQPFKLAMDELALYPGAAEKMIDILTTVSLSSHYGQNDELKRHFSKLLPKQLGLLAEKDPVLANQRALYIFDKSSYGFFLNACVAFVFNNTDAVAKTDPAQALKDVTHVYKRLAFHTDMDLINKGLSNILELAPIVAQKNKKQALSSLVYAANFPAPFPQKFHMAYAANILRMIDPEEIEASGNPAYKEKALKGIDTALALGDKNDDLLLIAQAKKYALQDPSTAPMSERTIQDFLWRLEHSCPATPASEANANMPERKNSALRNGIKHIKAFFGLGL
ncbi:MAG: hypothetical protein PHE27_03765 [Alphaproteobacteria bacterium]|nr:hypothetical protein [Alphaproteobacteria bacterium]